MSVTHVRLIPAAVAAGFTVVTAAGLTASLVQPPRHPRVNRADLWGARPREALVLGAGGIAGAAWEIGMLCRLEEFGVPVREMPLVVGTSAGALVGSLLRSGIPFEVLLDLARYGKATYKGREFSLPGPVHDALASHRPVAPRDFLISPAFAARRFRVPHLAAAAAGLMPPSGFSLESLALAVDTLWHAARGTPSWPDAATWIVAASLRDGQRTVFGAPGEALPSLGRAVAASCAVPGALAPVSIDGRRYVDGAVVSMTNVDLALAAGADRIWVLHPMAGVRASREKGLVAYGEHALRRLQARQLASWVGKAHARGTSIVVLAPTSQELGVMGPRLMDASRAASVVDCVLSRPDSALPDVDPVAW